MVRARAVGINASLLNPNGIVRGKKKQSPTPGIKGQDQRKSVAAYEVKGGGLYYDHHTRNYVILWGKKGG